MKRALIIIALVGILASIAMYEYTQVIRIENRRLKQNYEAMLQDSQEYKTKAGANAITCAALSMTVNDLEANRDQLLAELADMSIKLKRAQSASRTAATTAVQVQTIVKDSIIYRDTALVRVQAIQWADPWVDVRGQLAGKRLQLDIETRDTLTHVVHRVPRRFLFFKWGTKALRQDVRSSNPHTHITYNEYIEIK